MGVEIERKFLVCGDRWRKLAKGTEYRQGYLPSSDLTVVRIRKMGQAAVLTIKGRTTGVTRQEYEYTIPKADADEMLNTLCRQPLIEKTRYQVQHEGTLWEIDEFEGDNRGLIVAEVELEREDQTISLPDWIGREVSDDSRYFNVNLASNPYKNWKS